MKKLMVLIVLFVMMGCSGWQITTDEHTTPILVKITSRNVGCAVAKTGDLEIDRGLRNIYTLVETGEVPVDAIKQLNELSQKYTDDYPTLVVDLLDLVSLFGIQFNTMDEAQKVEIPPEILKAVADGYVSGFDLCLGK